MITAVFRSNNKERGGKSPLSFRGKNKGEALFLGSAKGILDGNLQAWFQIEPAASSRNAHHGLS